MKQYSKGQLVKYLSWQRDRRIRRQEEAKVERYLRNLRTQGRNITESQINQCIEYATEVLGDSRYAPSLKVFTAVQSTFKEGWIPPNYYEDVVIPKLKSRYGDIGNMNTLVGRIFPDLTGHDGIFPNLVYFSGGHFMNHRLEIIPDDKVEEILFSTSDKVVFKADGNFGGAGIRFIERKDFDPFEIRAHGFGFFQEVIKQHRSLSEFNPHSVATLRINTVVGKDGSVKMPLAFLRVGIENDSCIRQGREMLNMVDRDGKLLPVASLEEYVLVEEHPNTRFRCGGFAVPKFQEAVELCVELQKRVPFICSIGWDISIDQEERVRILEYNTRHNGFQYGEALVGPCFSEFGWESLWRD